MRGAVVIAFPESGIVAAYRTIRSPKIQDDLQLALAASVLVEAIKRCERVPPDTVERLVCLAARGARPVEFQRRLAEALFEIQDGWAGSAEPVQHDRRRGRRP